MADPIQDLLAAAPAAGGQSPQPGETKQRRRRAAPDLMKCGAGFIAMLPPDEQAAPSDEEGLAVLEAAAAQGPQGWADYLLLEDAYRTGGAAAVIAQLDHMYPSSCRMIYSLSGCVLAPERVPMLVEPAPGCGLGMI